MPFALEPCDLGFLREAPFRFVNEALLPAPPEKVFAVLADDSTWPHWFKDFVSITWLSAPPHGTGSTRIVRTRMGSVNERFLVWEPGRRLSFYFESMNLPLARRMMEDMRLEAAGPAQTRFRWEVVYVPTLPVRLLHPLVRLLFGRLFRESLRGLETYLERG